MSLRCRLLQGKSTALYGLSTFLFDQLVTVIFYIYNQYSNETCFIQNNTQVDMWKFLDAIYCNDQTLIKSRP
jgi:hypothetical protein